MASVQDQDVLRNMILTFRVTDLQMLLGKCYITTKKRSEYRRLSRSSLTGSETITLILRIPGLRFCGKK